MTKNERKNARRARELERKANRENKFNYELSEEKKEKESGKVYSHDLKRL